MPEPKIERYEVIIPTEIDGDTYGNITIKTKDGKEIKVNKKHESLHEVMRQATSEGRAVKLGYAVYLNKEYIHTAELLDGQSQPPAPQAKPTPAKEESGNKTPPTSVMTPDKWEEKDRVTRKSIERQTSLNAAVEVAKLAGQAVVTTEKILATAKVFEAYLEGKEVQPAKSRLVEEARKLGAIEIKKGEE